MRRTLVMVGMSLLVSCAGSESADDAARVGPDARGGDNTAPEGGDVGNDTGGDGADEETSAVRNAPRSDTCLTSIPPEAIALTPRAHPSLEHLAIAMDGSTVADPSRYERLVGDVEALQALHAAGNFEFQPRATGIMVQLTPEAWDAARAGTYDEWDCLVEAYGARIELAAWHGPGLRLATLDFPGAFDLALVIQDFESLSGVEYAEPNSMIGAARTFCAGDGAEGIVYLAIEEWGDCPAGCIHRRVTGFRGVSPGFVEAIGVWERGVDGPEPAWAVLPEGC